MLTRDDEIKLARYDSRTNKGTGTGVYGHGTRQTLSLRLGKYNTVFQAEVYNIKA
jgi:hypothetical protein